MLQQDLEHINLPEGKKIYFASDFHLGIDAVVSSRQREQQICEWLQHSAKEAQHIFLLGDIFDAWLEYKHVVPKGFVRLLGTLAQLRDQGIDITVFTGNHDLWMYGYFQEELDIKIIHQTQLLSVNDKKFVIGHGDGIGPGDRQYKILKAFLRNKITQYLYRWLHPDIGIPLAQYSSKRGLYKKDENPEFLGNDKEYQIQFAHNILKQQHIDYFIFGHRHIKLQIQIADSSLFTNLGDWLQYNSYAEFDGANLYLKQWQQP